MAALDGGGVVALTQGFGLMSSADAGVTWTLAYPIMAGHLAVLGRHAFVGGSQGLYVFDIDAGTNAPVPTPFDPRTMTGMWSGGGRLWMANGPLRVGENEGTNWRQITAYDTFHGVLPDGTALLSASVAGQWAITTDGGATFTVATTPPATVVEGLVKLPTGELLGYGGGTTVSSDGGITWSTRAATASIALASVQVDASGVLWGSTSSPPSQLVSSHDLGATWQVEAAGGGKHLVFDDHGVLFIAGTNPPSGLLCADPGQPWLRLCGPRAPLSNSPSRAYALDDNDDLWANLYGHLLKRTPDDAWRYVHNSEPVASADLYNRPIATKPGKVITLTEHTEDGGQTWIGHDLGLFPQTNRPEWHLSGLETLPVSGKVIASIAVKDASGIAIERGAVYTSSDDGRTWTLMSEQVLTAIFDLVSDRNDIVFGTEIVRGGDRINVRSEDGGRTWIELDVAAIAPIAIDLQGHLAAFQQPMGGATVLTYWRNEDEGWLQRDILPEAGVLFFERSPRFDRDDRLWFVGVSQAIHGNYLYRSKHPATHD